MNGMGMGWELAAEDYKRGTPKNESGLIWFNLV